MCPWEVRQVLYLPQYRCPRPRADEARQPARLGEGAEHHGQKQREGKRQERTGPPQQPRPEDERQEDDRRRDAQPPAPNLCSTYNTRNTTDDSSTILLRWAAPQSRTGL
jgi:hypothetical protein